MYYIQANQIQKSYGSRKVVKGIDLKIGYNEILAVIGPNGAGKSTTLEIIVGLRKADSGELSYWRNSYKSLIGVQLQSVPFFPGLTALENLKLFAAFYKKRLSTKETEKVMQKCGLGDCSHTEASKLSGGQQKRLAIATAIVHHPELIFLDEPTAALDPRSRLDIHKLITGLHEEGKTVVFTSHDMDEVLKLATRIIMIDNGNLIAEGEPSALCREHNVKDLEDLYLKLTTKEELIC
ncbi:ABC transporter ATP-binding protein [Bacillus massilinigeriensis]|uniref:ABC transporter ATP-binding protein n=1 Tax=Bacillus massilionigeriensis TaxID=1805475 RepID=UPI00096B3D3B|nr:ABC transporter ATP-binding protein [Bacillus massilionigeriensis]